MENGIAKKEKTAISSSTVINGDITAKEHLIINGTVKGNIQVKNHNLFIGPNGRLDGDVNAQNVRVKGHMRGLINASGKVEITKEANYSGKIICKNILVEEGAYFDASVELGRGSVKSKDVQKTSSETTFTELG
jgi:cytoskeletal protein CcmA (bactofilin family)